jgi:hypothetical protein
MFRKSKVAAFAILASVLLATAPLMIYAQGQLQVSPEENFVKLVERAADQIQNLIDLVDANETAKQQIENVGLLDEWGANVTLYEEDGLVKLADAQQALADSEYETAVDAAVEALRIFREVYSSLHVILEAADLRKGHLIENQGLLEAITRELKRIDRLKEILPAETPQEIWDLLAEAEGSLNEARGLLLDGYPAEAKSAFLDAKASISEVYQYLKAQAEESNTWRLRNYCEMLQERIRERFRYGREEGIDFSDVLQSYGYQSESQFMEALQNRTQTSQSEQNFDNAIQECEQADQMVQQMEQALNQEIIRQQGQNGPGSGGNGGP